MNRAQLEHAIRAACAVADDDEVYVLGSQSILGQHPTPHPELTLSMEVDIAPKNRPDAADQIDGSLGELSLFNETHGFYVDGLAIESAVLPAGWAERCIRVQNANTSHKIGWCLECHDLAVAKLVAFRDKDRDFVRVLLRERLIQPGKLQTRLQKTTLETALRSQITTWVRATAAELGLG
jgi:hypothetical protein